MNLTPDIYKRIVAAKVYIDTNYHEPIDLEQISQQAFCPGFIFTACLPEYIRKHRTNISPRQELKRRNYY